jgi:hypothetical protein
MCILKNYMQIMRDFFFCIQNSFETSVGLLYNIALFEFLVDAQYHRVGRVLSVSPVVGIGTPPPL